MGSSGTAEPFGLLHHHRRELSGTRAVHVVLAQGMSELIIDQITPVVSQVRSVGIGAEQPTLGVQHHAIAVPT
jgi:hypothetical protein